MTRMVLCRWLGPRAESFIGEVLLQGVPPVGAYVRSCGEKWRVVTVEFVDSEPTELFVEPAHD